MSTTKYVQVAIKDRPSNTSDPLANSGTKPYRRFSWRQSRAVLLRSIAIATVAVAPVVIATWLPLQTSKETRLDLFEGTSIGGAFTLSQAKAIDFITSAILGPLVLAGLNYIWFANARACITDEKRVATHGAPLYALVEAAGTSSGSYNTYKFWTLFWSRSKRLIAFALLPLFAALAKSLLSNIIAYEAIFVPLDGASISLRLLTGPKLDDKLNTGGFFDRIPNLADYEEIYGTSNPARVEALKQQGLALLRETTSALQGVAWQDSTPYLASGTYIGTNVTNSSLQSVDKSITELKDIPALKASIDCKPHVPQTFDYYVYPSGVGLVWEIEVDLPDKHVEPTPGWTTMLPGSLDQIGDADGTHTYTQSLQFLAYPDARVQDKATFFAGGLYTRLEEWMLQEEIEKHTRPIPSPYGDIYPTVFKMTPREPYYQDTCSGQRNCSVIVWGLACTVSQISGSVNLRRAQAQDLWESHDHQWDMTTKHHPPSYLENAIRPGAPREKPGIGTMIFQSAKTHAGAIKPNEFNYQILANNLLFAEMELQRIAYENGAKNDSFLNDNEKSGLFITAATVVQVQRYRMTYTPALLAGSLAAIFAAALVTA